MKIALLAVLVGVSAWLAAAFKTPTVPVSSSSAGQDKTGLNLKIPDNSRLTIFSPDASGARVLIQDPRERVIASLTSAGQIIALEGTDQGEATQRTVLARGLNRPHGMVMWCIEGTCKLFVAETDKITRFDYDADSTRLSNPKRLIGLPTGGQHTTKSLALLGEGLNPKLLVSIGSSCDACLEKDSRRAKVLSMDLNGENVEIYASGLRNAVFMTANPWTGQIWTTEMGRDNLGNDIPPDEINILKQDGNYGWPFCYGKRVQDVTFDASEAAASTCSKSEPAYIDLQAHSAPLGLSFVPEQGWPASWHRNLIVAYHGSWNRSPPTGYKVVRINLDADGKFLGIQDLITGWRTNGGNVQGRPTGILTMPNGSIFIADDKKGVIYKLKIQ